MAAVLLRSDRASAALRSVVAVLRASMKDSTVDAITRRRPGRRWRR
ncbi:MAG: hypothetical protein WDO24_11200 [Pseudomonadota bacterium]